MISGLMSFLETLGNGKFLLTTCGLISKEIQVRKGGGKRGERVREFYCKKGSFNSTQLQIMLFFLFFF